MKSPRSLKKDTKTLCKLNLTRKHPIKTRNASIESLEHKKLLAVIGDVNGDEIFGTADLVRVIQAGKYETGEFATWNQGDWNSDQRFNSGDLTLAFASNEATFTIPHRLLPPTNVSVEVNQRSIRVLWQDASTQGTKTRIAIRKAGSADWNNRGTVDYGQEFARIADLTPGNYFLKIRVQLGTGDDRSYSDYTQQIRFRIG